MCRNTSKRFNRLGLTGSEKAQSKRKATGAPHPDHLNGRSPSFQGTPQLPLFPLRRDSAQLAPNGDVLHRLERASLGNYVIEEGAPSRGVFAVGVQTHP